MKPRNLILLLALMLVMTGSPALAAKKKAAMSEQQMIAATYAKGVEMVNHRKWNAGIEALTKVIDNPKTSQDIMANALANRGAAYSNKKMYAEAMAALDKAIGIKPDLQNALYERARVEAMLGKHDKAVQDLTKAIGLEGSSPTLITAGYYYNRGISYMNMSPPQPDKAKADFAMAKKLNPKLKIPVKYKDL